VYDETVDGDPASFRCEEGDCGKFCADSSTCLLGCDVCWNNRCIWGDLAVSIIATDDDGWKIADINETIYLNVTGHAGSGLKELWVSDSVNYSIRGPSFNCLDTVAHPSGRTAGSFNVEEITDPFVDVPLIPWRSVQHPCSGAVDCKRTWETNESFEGRFCYFALALESPDTGLGRYSMIAADYVDIGYLKVILVNPKPETPN